MVSGRSPGSAGTSISTKTRRIVIAALSMLAGSLVCVAIAPGFMPQSYTWMEHSISESAAQGVDAAWIARLGFLLLGLAVLVITTIAGDHWGVWGRLAHGIYGASMIAAAAFSHMHWEDIPFDAFEDSLHSTSAFMAGFAFTGAVIIVSFHRPTGRNLGIDMSRLRL